MEFGQRHSPQQSQRHRGAEIEQVIIARLYEAHANDAPLTTEIVANKIRSTRPLSVVRAEEVNDLREWADERTVMADQGSFSNAIVLSSLPMETPFGAQAAI